MNITDIRTAIKYVVWYITNKWTINESCRLFGGKPNDYTCLGVHVWNIYTKYNSFEQFWFAIDTNCQDKIIQRALEIYNK